MHLKKFMHIHQRGGQPPEQILCGALVIPWTILLFSMVNEFKAKLQTHPHAMLSSMVLQVASHPCIGT